MFFVLEVGVTAFVCMVIIFVMVVILFSDLLDVYLNSESQYAELVEDISKLGDAPQPLPESKVEGNPESDRKFIGN